MCYGVVTIAASPVITEPLSSPYRYVLRALHNNSILTKYVVHTEYTGNDGKKYYESGHYFDVINDAQKAFKEAYAKWLEKVNKQAEYVLNNSKRCCFMHDKVG
jgi:hypothetical protein